jgi:hypothetical protein
MPENLIREVIIPKQKAISKNYRNVKKHYVVITVNVKKFFCLNKEFLKIQ